MNNFKSSYELLIERLEKENRITILSQKDSSKIITSINEELYRWEKEEGYKYPKVKVFMNE